MKELAKITKDNCDFPPLLVTDAGKSISDSKEWESARRGELRTWFLENEYGVPPAAAKAPDVTFADAAPPRPAFDGIAVERRVKATCRGPYGVFSFEFTAYVPVKNVPSPAFLLIAARDIKEKGNDLARMQKTGYWPATTSDTRLQRAGIRSMRATGPAIWTLPTSA